MATGLYRFLLGPAVAVLAMPAAAGAQEQTYQLNIPAQSLDAALRSFARTTRQQILFDSSVVRGRESPALSGSYTATTGIQTLLAKSDLEAAPGKHGVYVIRQRKPVATDRDAASKRGYAASRGELSSGAVAAVATEEPPQDIVVTATRREQGLSKVPLSVVATTQQTLDKQGVRSIDDLARLTPSVTFTPDAHLPGLTNITIRGIQSTSGVPTTGIYIDDTPVQVRRGQSPVRSNPYPMIFDLERVEVLRGPQGTLFGTGSVGGAIRFIMPEPSLNKPSVYARAEVSTTHNGGESYEAGLSGGAPIIEDKLGFRASVWHRHEGGFIDRLDRVTGALVEKDMDYSNAYTARLALGWRPTERVTITPSVFFQNSSNSDLGIYEVDASQPSKGQFRNGVSKLPQTYRDRWYLPAIKAEVEFDKFTLFSNSSYLSRKTRSVSDDVVTDLSMFGGYVGPLPAEFDDDPARTLAWARQKLFTQELRLQSNDPDSRLNWVVGVFYSRGRIRESGDAQDPWLLQQINFGQRMAGAPEYGSLSEIYGAELYNGVSASLTLQNIKEVEKSVFAQFDYMLTDRLKATVGARYADSRYKVDQFDIGAWAGTNEGTSTHLESNVKPLTPKFGLSFQMTPRTLFYVNVAKGARGGDAATSVGLPCGADAATLGIDPLANRPVASDSVWSYEVGTKSRLFGGRMSIDASAYRIDWSNVQTTLRLQCGFYTTLNYGDARSEGFDIALGVEPLKGLQLGASISYTNARYITDIPGADPSIVLRSKGEPLNVAPWAIYLNGEYDFDVGANSAYVRADFAYTSRNKKPLDLASPLVDPDIPRPAATSNLDLRAGLRIRDFDLSIFASNVLNNHPELARFHDVPGTTAFRAVSTRPRTIGLTASFRM